MVGFAIEGVFVKDLKHHWFVCNIPSVIINKSCDYVGVSVNYIFMYVLKVNKEILEHNLK